MGDDSFERLLALLLMLVCFSVGACGAPAPPMSARPPAPSAVARLTAGAVLAVPKPTPGLVRLSLWFDVGARDAETPALATAAALWATRNVTATPRVGPDTIDFHVECDTQRDAIDECVTRLASVFRAGKPKANDVVEIRSRMREMWVRARASETRAREELAFEALFGSDAHGLFPLGKQEGWAIDPQAIGAFTSQFFRPDRAILVGVGDVRGDELERAFQKAAPRVTRSEPSSRKELVARGGLRVEGAESSTITIALAVPDMAIGAAMAREISPLYEGARLKVSRLREHALLVLHVNAPAAPFRKLQRLAFDVRRAALEVDTDRAPVRGESLSELSAELGEEWALRHARPVPLPFPWPMGVALTVQESTFKISDDAKAKTQRVSWEQSARESIERGEELALGPVRGADNDNSADVEAESGARVRVERREGARFMAAFVRFASGSADDPPDRHGRAALLATLIANGCGIARGRSLDARLDAIDARMRPLVTPDGLGVRIVAPIAQTRAALDVLLRCALRPALDARAVEDGRARLISTLHATEASLFEAFAAQATLPEAPGEISVWGTPLGVSRVDASELRRLHERVLVGRKLDVFVIADEAPKDLARFAARRVGSLEPGKLEARTTTTPKPGQGQLIGEHTRVRSLHTVIALHTGVPRHASVAAIAVASALAAELEGRAQRVSWSGGGSAGGGTWSAVAVQLSESELASFDARAQAVLEALRAKSDVFWLPRLRAHARTAIAERGTSEGAADLFFASAPRSTNEQAELAAVREVLAAAPGFAVLRPPR